MGSASGVRIWATWEDPEGGFIKFAIKRALKQDQTLHMEEKLQFIHYFSREWCRCFGFNIESHTWKTISHRYVSDGHACPCSFLPSVGKIFRMLMQIFNQVNTHCPKNSCPYPTLLHLIQFLLQRNDNAPYLENVPFLLGVTLNSPGLNFVVRD